MKYDLRPSQEAIKDWYKIQSFEDVLTWHQYYTPWLKVNTLKQIEELYQDQITKIQKQKAANTISLFEKLSLESD